MRRYREWTPPEGPLEPADPLSSEAWLWSFMLTLNGLALLGLVFG